MFDGVKRDQTHRQGEDLVFWRDRWRRREVVEVHERRGAAGEGIALTLRPSGGRMCVNGDRRDVGSCCGLWKGVDKSKLVREVGVGVCHGDSWQGECWIIRADCKGPHKING